MSFKLFRAVIFLITGILAAGNARAQLSSPKEPYEWSVRPSVWFNTVDGVQAGARVFGFRNTPGTGDYRLYAGLWINTFWPDVPVNYSIRLDHPVGSWSNYREEFTVGGWSVYRAGHLRNQMSFTKRFQHGTEDDQFWTVSLGLIHYQQYSDIHLLFPGNWSGGTHYVIEPRFYLRSAGPGYFHTSTLGAIALAGDGSHKFDFGSTFQMELNRNLSLGIGLRIEQQVGGQVRPEFMSALGTSQPFDWFTNLWYQARGTVPVAMQRSGATAALSKYSSMRGYILHDMHRFGSNSLTPVSIDGICLVSAELYIPRSIEARLKAIPVAGTFLHFRTYLFADAAHISYGSNAQTDSWIANAGTGLLFRINIPDYLAQERGFTLRWDLPVWVSDPVAGEKPLKFRHLLSMDLIIPF